MPAFPSSEANCVGRKNATVEVVQVSHTNRLEGGRRHHSIGRIRAFSGWRAVAAASDADRAAADQALIREAEEYEADAIVGLNFEIDGLKCADLDGTRLQRVAATGIAVKFERLTMLGGKTF
jgi:uncharacterized protein YbjQ (UPF0145 family)